MTQLSGSRSTGEWQMLRELITQAAFTALDRRRTRGFHLMNDLRYWLKGVDSSEVVLDIGANVGAYAKDFRRRLGRDVFAFEPVSSTHAMLEAAVATDPRIHPFRLAVGAERGSAEIAVSPLSSEVSSLRPNAKWHADSPREVVSVTTVDGFLADHGNPRVAVMKVDVEGFEREVLCGAAQSLAAGRARLLVLETAFVCTAEQPRVLMTELIEILTPYGYEPWGIYDCERVERDRGGIVFMNAVFGLGRRQATASLMQ